MNADELKREILEKVAEYTRLVHLQPAPFTPGVTPVPYAGRVFDAHEVTNLVEASLEFWLTHGRHSRVLEVKLAKLLGVRHCLLVNSGSSANLLAFMALTSPRLGDRAIRQGDEVITVAAGFPTTVAPIVQFGAIPVFVDVDLATANIDVTRLEAARGPRTRAVMIAHTLGNPFDLDAVTAFCERHGLWLVEDNCDALGSLYAGRLTGGFGHVATSSFYPPHHMTMGEGGAVYTSSEELADVLESLRDWGRDCYCPSGRDNTCGKRFDQQFGELPHGYDHKYVYSHFGYNLKATDLQAAIGLAQLEKLPGFGAARRENFRRLATALAPLEDVFHLPRATPGSDPSWFGYLLTLRADAPVSRREVVARLDAAKVHTRMLFAGNILKQPCFDAMRRTGEGYRVVGDLTNTDAIMERAFLVGVYPGLGEAQLAHTADVITRAVREPRVAT